MRPPVKITVYSCAYIFYNIAYAGKAHKANGFMFFTTHRISVVTDYESSNKKIIYAIAYERADKITRKKNKLFSERNNRSERSFFYMIIRNGNAPRDIALCDNDNDDVICYAISGVVL